MKYLKKELKVYRMQPKCECGELLTINYSMQMMCNPPRFEVACPACGYHGTMTAAECGGIVYEEVGVVNE